ncbi:MAG: hypothetical protein BGO69_00080 [Bacteroidetes bacterium 46-16]|nr:MAG: hypothetical protein BGO69_00080 [Bacteroidetes bacterium 46-16]
MKKLVLLLLACVGITYATNAQPYNSVTLTDTVYNQNFDNIASGLPTGWHVFTSATASSLGVTRDTSPTKLVLVPTQWSYNSGNFRNVASATAGQVDSATQAAASDRALGVRQVGYSNATFGGSDSGAAMCIQIANTQHMGAFKLSFDLQSLDTSSPRTTTWTVDWGTGADPTSFTAAAATGTMTTGGNTFSNNTINVDFGTDLDSMSGPIWIRVVALNITTGGGNRPTSAIDNFHLSYVNNSPVSVANVSNNKMPLSVIGNATTNQMTLGFTATAAGKYNVEVYDMTGRMLHNEAINAATGAQQYTLTGMNLAAGMYIVKLGNGTYSAVTKAAIH